MSTACSQYSLASSGGSRKAATRPSVTSTRSWTIGKIAWSAA